MRSILFMGSLSLVIAVGWINKISINLQQCDRICQTHVVICMQILIKMIGAVSLLGTMPE